MGPLKQSLVEDISLQRCNWNIFGFTGTMALFAKEAGFYRFWVFFRAGSLQNEVSDPPFFYISDIINSSSLNSKSFRKKSMLEKFDANVLKREYTSFVEEVIIPKSLKDFKVTVCEHRVDRFLASHLKSNKYHKLWNLVKCLSHGQAGVERGFSVNKEAMQYHLNERSLVPLRIIFDHIQSAGGILNVEMDKPLRNAVKSASSQYCNELKRQKEEEKSREQEEANKELNDQISSFQAKRKCLLRHCSLLNESAEKLCERTERDALS